ncbi:hypothetical protein PIB30_054221 [Stylosanthes scabra]|uniref:Chromatin-remodeling ATPase INO80 n=1 Tax=Stylosanthes scabra TaxID=79078 RepID=A0ABU6UHG4_9FABA|nr:hypothetical protein [Stylosanthes scabra]
MQNKSSLLSSEALPMDDVNADDQDALFDSSDAGPIEDDPEEAELKKEALKAAQEAVSKQKKLTSAFDSECLRLRQSGEADPHSQEVAGASDIDLQTPSTMPVASTVQTPELFKGCLKEYQLKGLQWLVNCYEQGLNGILADEMGLGKTIQAMVFLAHLAEEKNIWGPFLVVAPASVLNNWNEELERFCPELKRLPYWGGVAERSVLRKSINPKDLYRREAKFHIVITSYQLLVQDEKFFRRVKWQYMVLDEAQAIKNSTSIRWKTLLSFNCRNRLLLTGTPIQNNMAELIENHAEHGGTLNEHQLNRLIAAHCSDRNFSYKMIEELHDPWVKRLFVGFARTSESLGPRMPVRSPHHLIQEIDSELPISHPALKFTHDIFGCSPPMHNFDPAKLLTDSGKLQTLDILLKRLRAGNHRVLLFAQMTKMLNILEDYMNYRRYKYFRLDGSSTIQDRRDMVKDFQHRSDVFVFLLSTRAGGLGINLTAADTVIFYESDWNPTLDLQAMDRAHRLGQTKDVTVYRLICKETVEEKILLRASQKSTVQNLVMTGGSVGGDLLAPEDVVSLLLDDVQLEQKLKEIPIQVKDKEKRKQPTKGIRVNEDGDASLEDLTNSAAQGTTDFDLPMDPEGSKSSNKKRKAASKPRNSQKTSESGSMAIDFELDDNHLSTEPVGHKPKRPKRTKNVNEDSFTASASIFPE